MRLLIAALLFSSAALQAQKISIRVQETAGIRRTAFPVEARIPFLGDPEHVRLMLAGKEVPAQFSNSAKSLDVDFNASIGPLESQTYELEYGPDVKPGAPPRGLSVTDEGGVIQIGSVRFNKSGSPLIASVKYRAEDIGQGVNGLVVTDKAGKAHDLSSADSLKTEIVKRGPLLVEIRYAGKLPIDSGYSVPFSLIVSMPNSKTMISVAASVEDPQDRVREIAFGTPLALGPLPLVWDLGTSHWTYGSFRSAGDSATLTQKDGGWSVVTGPVGKEQPFEQSGANAAFVQWAHLQDAKEVVAFGWYAPKVNTGMRQFSLDGNGQATIRYAPSVHESSHGLTLFEHFVSTPVQIGAATSPAALLSPLKVEVIP
ncbi:MAG TPA: hypothetical protein VG273_10140 [Bryobacteraceae bacterium]|jgi:hypothetical protein|nr:hypothetical protein [Bryobacteraceae bacterium]